MAENFAFYSQIYDAVPVEQLRGLAGTGNFLARLFRKEPRFTVGANDEGGRTFTFAWSDLKVTCNEMPAEELPSHLDGFRGYIQSILGPELDERGKEILDRINYSRLVLGVVVEPKRDDKGRAENLLGAISNGLQALLFYGDALFDQNARLILGPDQSFDADADVLGPVAELIKDRIMVDLPKGEPYRPTPAQSARAERTLTQMRQRKVPMLDSFLHVDDDDCVTLRDPADVARRVLALSAVTLRADGGPRSKALELIERSGCWAAVSPEETEFLQAPKTDPEKARKLLWRLEGLWVLGWAMGDLELNWPATMCDVPRLSKWLMRCEANPDFIARATLRLKKEILDAQQLTLLLHWAIRDAFKQDDSGHSVASRGCCRGAAPYAKLVDLLRGRRLG